VIGVLLAAVCSVGGSAQRGGSGDRAVDAGQDMRLPNGKMQRDEILKAEYEQNLKDAAKLADLSEELKQELEKNDRYVLSMNAVKMTNDIEKLAKKIRGRLRRN
jgi:hypothetical protein